jgi:hypothetical protein
MEPGARHPNGDIKLWLLLGTKLRDDNPEQYAFPWPFENNGKRQPVDVEKLVTWYNVTNFKHWPLQWDSFRDTILYSAHVQAAAWVLDPKMSGRVLGDDCSLISMEVIYAFK